MLTLTPTTAYSKSFNPAFPAQSFSALQPAQRFGSVMNIDAYTARENPVAFSLFRFLTGQPAFVQTAASSVSASNSVPQNPVSSLLKQVASLFQGKPTPAANTSKGLFILG